MHLRHVARASLTSQCVGLGNCLTSRQRNKPSIQDVCDVTKTSLCFPGSLERTSPRVILQTGPKSGQLSHSVSRHTSGTELVTSRHTSHIERPVTSQKTVLQVIVISWIFPLYFPKTKHDVTQTSLKRHRRVIKHHRNHEWRTSSITRHTSCVQHCGLSRVLACPNG